VVGAGRVAAVFDVELVSAATKVIGGAGGVGSRVFRWSKMWAA
jgi:hypothetical protein